MKIAFVINDLSNTGTNIATRDLIFQLKKSYNIDSDIYYFDVVNGELEFNVKKRRIRFLQQFDFSRYDIIHSSQFRSDLYVHLHKFLRKSRTRFITSVHSIIEHDLTFTYGNLISRIVAPFWLNLKKNNDAIFVSSDSMHEHYKELFRRRNVNTIEYGRSIDPDLNFEFPSTDLETISAIKAKFKIIGTVGSLIKRKNYAVTVTLLKKYRDYAWICLGTGEEHAHLVQLLNDANVADRAVFLGFKTDSRPYYQYFDIFFHPSKSEGFPLVVIDAMSHKVPMLLNNLTVYRSNIKEDMAFYFDADNESSLYDAFERIQKNRQSAGNAVNKSYSVYRNKFSMECYVLKHYEVFNDILGKK